MRGYAFHGHAILMSVIVFSLEQHFIVDRHHAKVIRISSKTTWKT